MFSLLNKRKFWPFFYTMGLGAFNDNLFKSALAILIAYNYPKENADLYIQVSAGLFILPFFLFSGVSGQICDKYEKSGLMRKIKSLEIIVMLLGFYSFYTNNINLQFISIFLMGTQSTLFGPVKYSILPLALDKNEILPGNSLTSMGTFVFILAGTILGGYLVSGKITQNFGLNPIAISVLFFAILGRIFSSYIPIINEKNNFKIKLNPFKVTLEAIKRINTNKHTTLSIHGISWFWFFGFFFMASLPSFVRDVLKGDELTSTLFLTLISIGMGVGSILCNYFSENKLKVGIVPFASIGLTVSALCFSMTETTFTPTDIDGLSGIENFSLYWKHGLYVFLIGVFGGAYIVPLYTLLQLKTPKSQRSQYIASNNIMNAIYMVSAALTSLILLSIGLEVKEIFITVSILNILSF
ncbi:MAG: hypothetical protein CME61_02805, partial [Halobacteriovoraceae bacterium]|nr:hypothetical protein [Halobacteriovoraceae bacterium]